MTEQFTIRPKGPFSLEEAADFGFGQRLDPTWDGVLRFAFCVDAYRDQVGVEIRQADLDVHCLMHGEADVSAVERQVARVLSLDYDGEAFLEVGGRDPIIGQLQALAPGLRPPLYSPYEAAAWSIISARRPARQMAEVRRELSEAHGRVFELAGQRVAALPLPEQLLAVESFWGLTPEKIERLHGVARAAMHGTLNVERIKAMDPEAAMENLRAQGHRPVLQRADRGAWFWIRRCAGRGASGAGDRRKAVWPPGSALPGRVPPNGGALETVSHLGDRSHSCGRPTSPRGQQVVSWRRTQPGRV